MSNERKPNLLWPVLMRPSLAITLFVREADLKAFAKKYRKQCGTGWDYWPEKQERFSIAQRFINGLNVFIVAVNVDHLDGIKVAAQLSQISCLLWMTLNRTKAVEEMPVSYFSSPADCAIADMAEKMMREYHRLNQHE